eukprot:9619730-Lingulodinium_polyedra.AAC.1
MAALCLDDPEAGSQCMAWLQECWAAFTAAKGSRHCKSAWWKKALARSVFNHPFNKHLVSLSLAANWDPADTDLRHFICQSWSALGQTKVVEDAFQRQRRAEEKLSENRTLSVSEVWAAPIRSQVLSQVHRFQELPWKGVPRKAGDPTSLPK